MNCLPTCHQYTLYLDLIVRRQGITNNEARKLYGLFTVAQWIELLKR